MKADSDCPISTMGRLLIMGGLAVAVLAAVVVFGKLQDARPARNIRDVNSLLVIAPYKYEGMWVFDDPAVGLAREPFIAGIDTMIDKAVAAIPNAEKGFRASSAPHHFQDHNSNSNGDAKNPAAIGTTVLSSTWRAGFVRRSSNISQPRRGISTSKSRRRTESPLFRESAFASANYSSCSVSWIRCLSSQTLRAARSNAFVRVRVPAAAMVVSYSRACCPLLPLRVRGRPRLFAFGFFTGRRADSFTVTFPLLPIKSLIPQAASRPARLQQHRPRARSLYNIIVTSRRSAGGKPLVCALVLRQLQLTSNG